MYYDGRWEREFFEKKSKFHEPPLWFLCQIMLVGPTLAAIISLAVWVGIACLIR